MESAAERRIRKAIEEGQKNKNVGKTKKIKAKQERTTEREVIKYALENSLPNYLNRLLDGADQKGFGIRDGRQLNDLELLTELQHFGAATCLLDFSTDPLVALYFACADKGRNAGKIFILRNANFGRAAPNASASEIIEKGDLLQWKPVMHGAAERRIICQSGIFVINLKEQAEKQKNEKERKLFEIPIPYKEKKKMLDELRDHYEISAETLFIDLAGFSNNYSADTDLPKFEGAFHRGNVQFKEAKWNNAIKEYTKAIRFKPDFVTAYYNRGLAKNEKGDFDGAIADYGEAIRLRPDYAEAYCYCGVAKLSKQDFDGAIEYFDKAIRLKPDYAEAYFGRGTAKFNKKDFDGAIKDFDEAIGIAPDMAEAYRGRGVAKLSKQDFDGAIKDFDEAIRLKPDDAMAYFARGRAYFNRFLANLEKKDLLQAERDAKQALDLAEQQNLSMDLINMIKRLIKDIEDKKKGV